MFEKLKEFLKKIGVNIPAEKEAELKADIAILEKDANGNVDFSKLDLSKFSKSDSDNPLLKTILEQNQALTSQVNNLMKALGDEKTARDNAAKSTEEMLKKEREQKVAGAIEKAFKEKKITEAEKDIWKARLEKDFDEWSKELDARMVDKRFEKKEGGTTQTKTDVNEPGSAKVSPLKTATELIRESMGASTKV